MFYDLNKYKYNLLIVLLSIITLVVLDRFTEISDFSIGLTGLITGIALLILSYYPLSNSANPSNAKPSNATKSNNANKKN
jgi:beta-lactamase regulating signal transducer with metallopeptidase domain